MVDAALGTLAEVDLVAVVVDATEPSGGGDRFLLDVVKRSRTPRILVLNKVDAVDKPALLPRLVEYEKEGFEDLVPVSALTGENIDRLEQVLLQASARRRPDLSRRLPDRSTRALFRRGTGARAGAATNP